jgi:response regulator RpfG family c-di-GMP phosphodiesterase
MAKKLINKVLIVDDSEENRMILEEICKNLGYDSELAENGKQALETLRIKPFDCILLDIKMPIMNGIELLEILKRDENLKIIPVIMVTGIEDSKSIVDCFSKGADDYITKPFENEILGARIKGVIQRHEVYLREKELVEKTFFGSVKLLSDLLASLSPHIYGKSNQIRRIARAICNEVHYTDTNEIELAALFSHIGCISLSGEIIDKLVNGKFLFPEEKTIFENHPLLGYKLLMNIPMLENINKAILYQNKNYDGSGPPQSDKISGNSIPISARILRAAIEYQSCRIRANSVLELSESLKVKESLIDPNIFKALMNVLVKEESRDLKELKVIQLRIGMIFASDVMTESNTRLASQWQEATEGIIERITNVHYQVGVKEPIQVFTS